LRSKPAFGVSQEKKMYGSFYNGDAYIVLDTYHPKDDKGKELDKLCYDLVTLAFSAGSSSEFRVHAKARAACVVVWCMSARRGILSACIQAAGLSDAR
jgi:hypothetical protein